MKDKSIGTAAVASFVILTILLLLINTSGFYFKAFFVKFALFLFVVTVVLSSEYLLKNYSTSTSPISRKIIHAFSGSFVLFSLLVSFDILSFEHTYNWLIATGIIYILVVQLQLLNWEGKSALLVKVCSFFVLISNIFLTFFFIAKWSYAGLNLWLNIAVALSVISFIIGIILTKDPKAKVDLPID